MFRKSGRRIGWRAGLVALCVLAVTACGGGGGGSDDNNGGGSGNAGAPPPGDGPSNGGDTPLGPPFTTQSKHNYAIYYGPLTAQARNNLKTYGVVILNPGAIYDEANSDDTLALNRAQIAEIQRGIDGVRNTGDDVTVHCYVTAGVDDRTRGLTDEELRNSMRFSGDGTGPRVDPRPGAPFPDGASLTGEIDRKGAPSPGGSGYASYYLDDNDYAVGEADGKPDRVGGGETDPAYVNFGDPAWFDALDNFTLARDRIAGLNELLTTQARTPQGYASLGLGCDGVMLDNVDPAAPNEFTDADYVDGTEFEWIAPGLRDFIERIRTAYPDKQVILNRGLFYFTPGLNTYAVTPRGLLDGFLLEDYRLDEDKTRLYPPVYYADNRYNVMPKLSAEANRPDGFPIYSLDYALGPRDKMRLETLRGGSDVGLAELEEDIHQAQDIAGFSHYFSNKPVAYLNDFVRIHQRTEDTKPPQWSSTYNNGPKPPDTAEPPEPRVGAQQVIAGNRSALLRWDVALDRAPLRYTVYYQDRPFNFDNDPTLTGAASQPLAAAVPDAYIVYGTGERRYPYQARITGLKADREYHFVIRATDPAGNEDRNRRALSATPYAIDRTTINVDGRFADWASVPVVATDAGDDGRSDGPDWRDVQITNDDANLYIRFTSGHPFNLDGSPDSDYSRLRIYIDADHDFGTGFYAPSSLGPIGSDLLVEGAALFRQDRSGDNNTLLRNIAVAPQRDITAAELAIPLSALREIASDIDRIALVFENTDTVDRIPDNAERGATFTYRLVD